MHARPRGEAARRQGRLRSDTAAAPACNCIFSFVVWWPQALPDADHAITFWTDVATNFKDNPLVLYELFNEPFPGKGSAGELALA